jgi:beta-lactamase regulating signal transducer with metallopeptidase domain
METISGYILTFLINATWQIAIITAIAAVASRLMGNTPASYRHAVWVAALLASVLLPLSSVRGPRATTSLDVSTPTPSSLAVAPAAVSTSNASAPFRTSPAPLSFSTMAASVVVSLYLLLVLFRLARFARAWMRTVRLKSRAEARTISPPVAHVWRRCADAFRVTRADLLTSAAVSSPVAIGASVIVPESFLTETSEEVLTAALGHEMAHVARHDFAANVFYELIHVAIAFHPASWIIRRQIEQTREMACDEAVTSRLLDPRVYARSIMQIASSLTNVSSPGYTLGIFDGYMLEQRIRGLLHRRAASLRQARVLLATAFSALAVCAVIASGVALTARAQSALQARMKEAVDAYNRGDFKTAIGQFTSAAALEPANPNPKLFLANALMRDFYAQEGAPDTRLLTAARRQYEEVLARDARNRQAVAGMTTIAMDGKQFREAREWAEKLAAIDPNDKTAWYTMGVLDWAMVFPEYQRAKQAAGGKQEDYRIPDANLRKSLRDEYLPRVVEGKRMLVKALALDPQYDQAMAYLNLLLRIESGMWDDPALAEALIAKADAWVGKALAAKRQRVTEAAPEAATLDPDGPPPGPAGRTTMVKAPPPPPPPPSRERSHQIASALPPPKPAAREIPMPGQFWQVLGAGDMRAMDLFLALKGKGFNGAMHAGSDHLVRVVVGPYFDEASIASAKTALDAAGFRVIRKWE